MSDLISFNAKICFTVVGVLIHQQKVLLVKHKKLGIWLAPGGHLEPGELPHQAAEREFWEETAIKVKAFNLASGYETKESQNLANPISSNLHWISEDNYHCRLKAEKQQRKIKTKAKACEQHLAFIYLVKPVAGLKYKQNVEETDGIAWFTAKQLANLETTEDIKREMQYAFKLVKNSSNASK